MGLTRDEAKRIASESRATQNHTELAKLVEYVSQIDPKVILEIGVDRGYSMETWRKAFNPDIIVGIDKDCSQVDPEAVHKPDLVLEMDSQEQESADKLNVWLQKDVDFLFIDSDCRYEAVKKNYELYRHFVRQGGVIGFHNIMLDGNEWRMRGVDVQRFWNQLTGRPGSKSFVFWDELGHGAGTGIYYIQ